jgi:hypothetical protein
MSSLEEGRDKVLRANYAFLSGSLSMKQYMAENGWERFHASRDGFFTNFYGVVVRKGSPLKPVVDKK